MWPGSWGLRKFILLKYGAYEKLTKEFLGTVRVAFEDVKSPKTAILYFRIGDTEYSITIRDLCKPLVSVIRTRFGSHTAKVLALNGQNLHMIPTKVVLKRYKSSIMLCVMPFEC